MDLSSAVYLNSGHFLLPLVYGNIPTDRELSVSVVEAMLHITGAYLSVRLGSGGDEIPKTNDDETKTEGVKSNDKVDSNIIASVLARSYERRNNFKLTAFPLNSAQIDSICRELPLTNTPPEERQSIYSNMDKWIANSFPSVGGVTQFINPRTMFAYDNKEGALVVLDMLHNMPKRGAYTVYCCYFHWF